MRQVRRRAIVPYSAEQMFDLVGDISAYPEFLPWCTNASILEVTDEKVVASIELERNGLRKTFTTKNRPERPGSLDMGLIDGPFRTLDGGWRFRNLGDEGCEVSLALDFEFTNFLVDLAFGRFFEQTCASLMDAFVQRSHEIYGEG